MNLHRQTSPGRWLGTVSYGTYFARVSLALRDEKVQQLLCAPGTTTEQREVRAGMTLTSCALNPGHRSHLQLLVVSSKVDSPFKQ